MLTRPLLTMSRGPDGSRKLAAGRAIRRFGAMVALLIVSVSCAPEAPQWRPARQFGTEVDAEAYPLVSMVAVLADPPRFDSRQIRVQAVLHLEFEGDRLCLDRDSAVEMVPQNCVRLVVSDALREQYDSIERYNGQYVLVAGTFDLPKGITPYPGRLEALWIVVDLPTGSRRRAG